MNIDSERDLPTERDTSFRAMAVAELRGHRWCGDCYPNNGWPGVNEALAQYALERRKAHNLPRNWCINCAW